MIKTKMTFPSRQTNTSASGYLLSTTRPCASTPCRWNIFFTKSVHTVVMGIRVSPFLLIKPVGLATLNKAIIGVLNGEREPRN